VVGRLRNLDDAAELDNGPALGDQLVSDLELGNDLFVRVPVRFVVKTLAQSSRVRTLLQPGPFFGIKVKSKKEVP